MALAENRLDLLQEFLDGEASETDAQDVRQRIATDPAWAEAAAGLREARDARAAAMAVLEPSDREASRLAERVIGSTRRHGQWAGLVRIGRIVAAVAACVALSFGAGWLTRGKHAPTTQNPTMAVMNPQSSPTAPAYQVTLTDAQGRVIGVQRFGSLEQAREFARDLQAWQERQQRIREGGAVFVEDQY